MSGEVGIKALLVTEDLDLLMNWKSFSSLKKIVLTMAWILRFIDNVRKTDSETKLYKFSLEEIEKATLRFIERARFIEFYQELLKEKSNP